MTVLLARPFGQQACTDKFIVEILCIGFCYRLLGRLVMASAPVHVVLTPRYSCFLRGAILSRGLAANILCCPGGAASGRPQRNCILITHVLASLHIIQVNIVGIHCLIMMPLSLVLMMILHTHVCLLNQFIIQFELCTQIYSSD